MIEIALEAPGGRTVCTRCGVADRPISRLRGLLGRRTLEPGEGLLLRPASSVHTAFMRFPIDVVFLDRTLRVKKVTRRVRPWRVTACPGAAAVVELPAGACERHRLEVGEMLRARVLSGAVARGVPVPGRVAALAALLASLALLRRGGGSDGALAAFTCAVLVVLAYVDAVSLRLPNRIVLPAGVLVLAARLLSEPSRWDLWLGASVGAAAGFLAIALLIPSALGMGDVKLALLLGAALGFGVLPALLAVTAAAATAGLALLARHGREALRQPIPLGPFLALGAIAVLLVAPT